MASTKLNLDIQSNLVLTEPIIQTRMQLKDLASAQTLFIDFDEPAGIDRTINFPDPGADDTACYLNLAQVFANKQITTGEGGMLVTDNEGWADLFRSLRNQGRDVFDAWLNHTRLGYNYRLDEMSAALGISQLRQIDTLIAARSQVADWYTDRLKDLDSIQTPVVVPSTSKMSWFVFVVRVTSPLGRNQVMELLNDSGIPSRPYFTPIHLQPFYSDKFGYQRGDYPHTEAAGDQCLALPFSSVMTEEQVEYVCNTLKSILHP